MPDLVVIGGGLAGCEAAWQAAERGLSVHLYEMRPHTKTGAHTGWRLAELVCSNSLGSNQVDSASGLLKHELRELDSLLVRMADLAALPAGGALAVDRDAFASAVTQAIEQNRRIQVIRKEVIEIPAGLTILASGPLTSPPLAEAIARLTGEKHLYFFDAIAPIVSAESIDMSIAFRASRYEKSGSGEGDYINCPMTEADYFAFVDALLSAERIELRDLEKSIDTGVSAGHPEYFEGCLPLEVQALRGREALAYGPLRPVGLTDPRSGRRSYAVVQLRQDDLAAKLYNMVGFQTNLTYTEQARVFRCIPGLQDAEFVRYGQMHRNTFLNSPLLLKSTLQLIRRPNLLLAGQITGVEGYAASIATGLLAGVNAARLSRGESALDLPATTMIGALCQYITRANPLQFQPMKANFGILPPLEGQGARKLGRKEKGAAYSKRALSHLRSYLSEVRGIQTL